ncbi:MAG: hypothetical protein JWM91_5416 [Rhodospirillales bacterium]|nr:hypothetical protein [Rhodospirillales bacterium]
MAAAIAALMRGDACRVGEDLDHGYDQAGVDLFADQLVGDRVEEAVELDMAVERYAGEAPLGWQQKVVTSFAKVVTTQIMCIELEPVELPSCRRPPAQSVKNDHRNRSTTGCVTHSSEF